MTLPHPPAGKGWGDFNQEKLPHKGHMVRSIIHILLHFLVPAVVARIAYEDKWKRAWLIMVSTMVIDLDHLFADPVYDPNRCGIGFHPFHSYYAIAGYILLTAVGKTRIIGLGLLIHVILDGLDCLMINFGYIN